MSIYAAPMPAGIGVLFRTICFTGRDAVAMFKAYGIGLPLLGTLIGAVIGFAIMVFFTNVEPITKLLGLATGGLIGASLGSTYWYWLTIKSRCPCPPGTYGICVTFWYFRATAGSGTIPLPPFLTPEPAACATRIPAGCP